MKRQPVTLLRAGCVYLWRGVPVYIVNGTYEGQYGISNYWWWRKIKKDGTLAKRVYSGYNNSEEEFFELKGKVEVRVRMNGKKNYFRSKLLK